MYNTEIHVKSNIKPVWADWFGEMNVRNGVSGETVLYGNLPDMAAVYGVISRLGSLVITLLSVTCTEVTDR